MPKTKKIEKLKKSSQCECGMRMDEHDETGCAFVDEGDFMPTLHCMMFRPANKPKLKKRGK